MCVPTVSRVCVNVCASSGGVLSIATSSFLSVYTMADSAPRGLACVCACLCAPICVCVCACVVCARLSVYH